MSTLTLRDLDNRGDDMAPYEFTGTNAKIIGYLDGPLRSDLTNAAAAARLDQAIELVRADKIEEAAPLLARMSIAIRRLETEAAK